ncbi:MAG: pyridoxal phosphate-dependent aminotransferase [Deltaproteobacteria bacterium]|nr:pyridoxal phosphate-dependent aminotransferase [Deltaproteobacteria bacterium]
MSGPARGGKRKEDSGRPGPSARAAGIRIPIIPTVAGWTAETPGTISLGQGVVHYGPPRSALDAIPEFLASFPHHRYVPDAGLPELRKAFEEKLRAENGIDAPHERRIYVTAGANQAFLNAILAVCDPGDEVILLAPYYFNHEMAVRLASAVPVEVSTDERLQPDLSAIEAAITGRTRAVVTVSPNNPTGAVYPEETLSAIHRLCRERGIYHISDEAYEYFTYDGGRHFSPGSLGGDHSISLFSFSKAYGMASWRVGFLVAPGHLYDELMKIQDTVVVCAPAISQHVALRSMKEGRGYCRSFLPGLSRVREEMLKRLAGIPGLVTVPPARGAFYLFARVNTGLTAIHLAERLVREHKVSVTPGETFGAGPGCWLRIAYGSLREDTAAEGIARLLSGLRAILGR